MDDFQKHRHNLAIRLYMAELRFNVAKKRFHESGSSEDHERMRAARMRLRKLQKRAGLADPTREMPVQTT